MKKTIESRLEALEEAKKFLKISSGIEDFADEMSEFHRANAVSFKTTYIEEWLRQRDIITEDRLRRECAGLLNKFLKCDDECEKSYQCYLEHHKLKKEIKAVQQRILSPNQQL